MTKLGDWSRPNVEWKGMEEREGEGGKVISSIDWEILLERRRRRRRRRRKRDYY